MTYRLFSILLLAILLSSFNGIGILYADTLHKCAQAFGHIDGIPCDKSGETELPVKIGAQGYYCCSGGVWPSHIRNDKCHKYIGTGVYEAEQHIDSQSCDLMKEILEFEIAPGYYCCRMNKCSAVYKGEEIDQTTLKGARCDAYCKNRPYKKKITVQSQPGSCCCKIDPYAFKEPDFYLQIPIGDLTKITAEEFKSGRSIPNYIIALYYWLVGFVLFLGVIAISMGGILWILAGGSEKRASRAKETVENALIGIFLTLGSWLFLWTISPNLVLYRDIRLMPIKEVELDVIASTPDNCMVKCWEEAFKRELKVRDIDRNECKVGEEKKNGEILEVCVENKCKCLLAKKRLGEPSLEMPPHPETFKK